MGFEHQTAALLDEEGSISTATMRAIQVARPNGPLELLERDMPEPGAGAPCGSRSRLAASATVVVHRKEGTWPGIQYPRVPGHEIAGIIDAVGPGVPGWNLG